MKISSPNYTQIPNVFFDHWMRELSPYSFVVLMCLSRKLFGWHKTSDRISKNQICKITGLSKNQVQKSIQELEEHGLIVKHQQKNEYGNQPNTYSLDIEKPIDDMYDDQNLGGGGSQYDLGVGHNMTQGVGHNMTPQKKRNTKEIHTKEIEENTRDPELFETFGDLGLVKLKAKEFEDLLRYMTEQERKDRILDLELAIQKIGEKEFNKKYKSHYATILSWKRLEDKKTQKRTETPQKSIIDKNTSIAKDIQSKLKKTAFKAKFEVFLDRIEIIDGPYQPFVLKLSENGFEEQLLNRLMKMNVQLT